MHISYLASIPIIERLIECFCSSEHRVHISYLTSIPIIERLIKFLSISKHRCHTSYLTSIPVPYILVERRIAIEHSTHVSYSRSYNSISRISICCNFCLNITFIFGNIVFLSFKQIFFTSFSTVCSFDRYSIGVSVDRMCTVGFTLSARFIVGISIITGRTSIV